MKRERMTNEERESRREHERLARVHSGPGLWAMRGPQARLHFYPVSGGELANRAICGAFHESFAYSETRAPEPSQCCGRCLRQRGAAQ